MTQQIINEIFHVLPAGSYQEIADRLSDRLGREVDWSDVNTAIADLRKAPAALYGWTIPHCKRGPYAADRLFAVYTDDDGTRVLSGNDTNRINAGLIGTLGHVHTMLGNATEILKGILSQAPTPAKRRAMSKLIRDLTYNSETAWEMREDCREGG